MADALDDAVDVLNMTLLKVGVKVHEDAFA